METDVEPPVVGGATKENMDSAEDDTFSRHNTRVEEGARPKEQSTHPKRITKPTPKLIKNRLQSDKAILEKLWGRTAIAITELQETPDSVVQLCSAITKVRFIFYLFIYL